MKTKIILGEPEQKEVRVKAYAGGGMVIDSGDSQTIIKGKKPILEKSMKVAQNDKKELMGNPSKFKLSKGRLVRKGKKQ